MLSFEEFINDEEGAVSVDWVILAAGVVSMALAASSIVIGGTSDLTRDVDGQLGNPLIKTSFD